MFKNHPKGLPVLFFTEMWERFGFYLMLGIFVLYMTDQNPAKSGLGMDEASASDIYGTYLALVYLTPFVGGLLADRVLGYRKSIVIGGILMGLGYLGLAIPVGQGGSMTPFWLSLLLIIIGNGFFKPNISSMVGSLYPKQEKNNGVKAGELELTDGAILGIIRYYTREAGVRALERDISKICRKVVKTLLLKKTPGKVAVSARNLDKFLGVRRYNFGVAERENQVGQVTGLAWTEVGGELLTIESVVLPGKGKTTTTGKLGEVMQESVQAALSVVRKRAQSLGIDHDFYQKSDIHIHLPEGAIPKDGPSAGIGICTALVSVLTGIPVCCDVAMTGEITLRGEVLPIGGLKEKLLAAVRGGLARVLIPEENVRDLAEIPDNIKNKLEIIPVRWIDQVLEHALEHKPTPAAAEEPVAPAVVAAAPDSVSGPNVVTH